MIKNKLDKIFGPFGTSTGFFLMLGGIVTTYFSLFGLLLVALGAFVTFTSTSAFIDTVNKRIKYSNNLFGIIPTGKWIDIKPGMKIGLKKAHRGYVGYIRGTYPVDIHQNDIRIYLYDSENKPVIPIQKFDSVESARKGLDNLCSLLGIGSK